jgi:methyltransferase (TIGR00027 family)
MSAPEPLIRNISDTALWVAVFRARESERPDAVFRDPYAKRLAGARGEQIAQAIQFAQKNAWSFVARTWIIDQIVTQGVAQGVDQVINLAAGLDARPYRLALPPSLRWVEVDLAPLIAYKEQMLGGEKPACRLERVALDLADRAVRARLFARLGAAARRTLVVTEGLLVYLSPEEAGALAIDLAAQPSFERWIIDLTTPPLLRMMQRQIGSTLNEARSPLKFSPPEGPAFFEPFGWQPLEVHSFLHVATRLKRTSGLLWLMAKLFPSEAPHPKRPWGGIVLLGRK